MSTTVGRLLARAKECEGDVGAGGFAGFMSITKILATEGRLS